MTAWTLPVLTYHAVGEGPPPLWTPAAALGAQLATLAEGGYRNLSLGHLLTLLKAGRRPPRRSFVLTFDDGYQSVFSTAVPLVEAAGFRGTIFLVSGRCGGDNQWPGQLPGVPRAPLMSWDEAAALAAAGWELGAHGRTHRPLPALTGEEAEEEMLASKEAIARGTGVEAEVFAYPYGAANRRERELAQRHFAGAVSARLRLSTPRSDPWWIPRIDSYYLSATRLARLEGPGFRLFLRWRRALRTVRRLLGLHVSSIVGSPSLRSPLPRRRGRGPG